MAAEQTIGIFEIIEALVGRLVTGIGNETIGIQQAGRTDKLVRIPPERGARSRTAGTQDALVQTIEFFPLLRRLQSLTFRTRSFICLLYTSPSPRD